jgi:hypothetical protein
MLSEGCSILQQKQFKYVLQVFAFEHFQFWGNEGFLASDKVVQGKGTDSWQLTQMYMLFKSKTRNTYAKWNTVITSQKTPS